MKKYFNFLNNSFFLFKKISSEIISRNLINIYILNLMQIYYLKYFFDFNVFKS